MFGTLRVPAGFVRRRDGRADFAPTVIEVTSLANSGGAGESRTPDTQFRKLLLYPSELQPRRKRTQQE